MPVHQGTRRLRLTVTVEIAPSEDGIQLSVKPADDAEALSAARSKVVLDLWNEGSKIVRGTITHASGAIAHFQGGEALIQMAQILGVHLKPPPGTAHLAEIRRRACR